MSDKSLELKRYPIGKFERPEEIRKELLKKWLKSLEQFPGDLENLLAHISDDDLESQYRPGSWTVRQIVHHLADSHINAYIRVKLALTEDRPVIKTYREMAWSELPDVEFTDIQVSLGLLRAVHQRWVTLLRSLNTAELKRGYYHPENEMEVSVAESIGLYAWHGEHHLAHIREALASR